MSHSEDSNWAAALLALLVEDGTEANLRSGHTHGHDHWWVEEDGGVLNAERESGSVKTRVLRPLWVVDDGNLVVVAIDLSASDDLRELGPRDAARSVEKTGRILNNAILDLGLHRLLVVVVGVVQDTGPAMLVAELENRGDFRVLLHDVNSGPEQTAMRVRPLELEEPFLRPLRDDEDAGIAAKLIRGFKAPQELQSLREAMAQDVEAKLLTGLKTGEDWSGALAALQALGEPPNSSDGNEAQESPDA